MIKLNIDNSKTLEFTQEIIRVGRNKHISEDIEIVKNKDSADIFIKNKRALSRKHCEIFKKDFQWYIKDLQSANGTYINNKQIEPLEEYPLRDKDKLLLSSDVCLCVSLGDEDSTYFEPFDESEPEGDKTVIDELIKPLKVDDKEHTEKSNKRIFYLEAINNRYKSYAFMLDFSEVDRINIIDILKLNEISGDIIFIFHVGYITLENYSNAKVSINNEIITKEKIIYNGNLIDINSYRFVFVEYTSREIINGRVEEILNQNSYRDNSHKQNDSYVKTEVVDTSGFILEEQTLELSSYSTLNNGQYIILKRLGEIGGFGITYLAEDTKLNSQVAIKEYFPKLYAKRDENNMISPATTTKSIENFRWGYEAFKKEAQTIANIPRHNNIVDVKNLFEENGTVYYVMAYAKGEDLESYIKNRPPLSEAEIKKIIFPFLDGVKHLHQYNILHRDIKLSNILITKSGNPILIDFGTARNHMKQRAKKLTTVYTEGYAPLEQQTGGEEGTYTDIYSIAMVIYAMMNGITVTEELPSAIKRLDNEQNKKDSTLKFPNRFSKSFIKAVKKGLEIQYKNRPQTVDEFIELLKKEERTPPIVTFLFIIIGVIGIVGGILAII